MIKKSDPPGPPDAKLFELTAAIQPARRAWLQAANIVLTKQGLTIPLATLLVHVARLGGRAPQGFLAQEIGVNPAALVRTLDQGEAAKLLVRHVAGDRRIRVIELTPKGKEEVQRVEAASAALRRQLLANISASDIETCTRVLRQFETAANEYVKEDRVG